MIILTILMVLKMKKFSLFKNLTKNRSINNYQEMYFNRKPFQLNNELKKLSNDLLIII